MASPIPARYTIPESIPHELVRKNITSLLSREVKVTVVVAPSGYGKSVVAAQWARQQQNVVWIRLTQEDRDAQYLVHALAEGIRLFGIALSNWNDHILREASVSRVVNGLLNDVNLWPDDLTFILDGGEYLSPDSAGVLASFADSLNGHRLILLQHDASPFELAPYVVRGTGQEINVQHLAFTAMESAQLSKTFDTPGADTQGLHENLQGWPAGMMLSLYAHDQRLTLTPDGLIRTLIQRLDPNIQIHLPALSVIEMWTVATPLALGLNLPAGWLAELQRVGLPMTAHGRTYAPHDVMRAYLQRELANNPQQEKTAHRYAGAWAERQGEPYTAVKHFLAAGEEKSALKVAEDLLPGWYRTANWQVARDVLSQFPDEVLSDELRSILALAYGETNDASKAEELALRQIDVRETGTAYFCLALKCYRTNEIERASGYVERGLKIATSQRDAIQLLRTKAILLLKEGLNAEALEVAKECVKRAVVYGDNALRLSSQIIYVHVHRHQSTSDAENLIASEQLYQVARETESPHRLMPVIQNYAIDLCRANQDNEGILLLNNFIEKYKESYPLCQQLLLGTLAITYRKAGQLENSLQAAKSGAIENKKAGFHAYVDDCLSTVVWHYIGSGNADMAMSAATEYLRYAEQNDFESPPQFGRLAIYSYALGERGATERNIVVAKEKQKELKTNPETIVYAIQLLLEIDEGESKFETLLSLCEAVKITPEDLGILKAGWKRLKPTFEAHALAHPENTVIREMIDSVEHSSEKMLFHVSIKTLGDNSLLIQNSEIRLGYASALESLVYHLLYPRASQDELAKAIWSSADLYKARGSSQKARGTLNKVLRDAVGSTTVELIQTSGPGRRNLEWHINPDVIVDLDALRVLNSQNAEEIYSLYQGQFLPGNSHDWVVEERLHINKHVSEIYQIKAAAEGNTTEALRWLMRAAMIDQEVATFEKARHLSIVLGENNIRQSVDDALEALAHGNEVQLRSWLN